MLSLMWLHHQTAAREDDLKLAGQFPKKINTLTTLICQIVPSVNFDPVLLQMEI